MTTLPLDPAILHTAAAHNNTRAGVYASVVRPGAIKVGDPVRPLD
jgi:MOSC domain-containing protein YiiM